MRLPIITIEAAQHLEKRMRKGKISHQNPSTDQERPILATKRVAFRWLHLKFYLRRKHGRKVLKEVCCQSTITWRCLNSTKR